MATIKPSMKLYLDNCCFNRPFDDQSNFRVRLEAEAKLRIQDQIRSSCYHLVWSYILDYENSKNPYRDRREQIAKWRGYAYDDIESSEAIMQHASTMKLLGLKQMDAFHVACAIHAVCDYFLTTDKGILKYATQVQALHITDPIGFIQETNP